MPRRLSAIERLPQAIAEQVVKRIVEMLDVNEIVERVDVDGVVQRIDVNALMARVDVDEVVERVDANALVEKVDLNELMGRVDVNHLLDRIDVNALMERVDVDEFVRRANLGPIIAQSTSGMMGEFLGLLRRQVVSLDGLLDRVTLHERRAKGKPKGPASLVERTTARGLPTQEGEYAGGVTRLLAFLADVGAIWGIFAIFVAGLQAAIRLFVGDDFTLFSHRPGGIVAYSVWAFCYFTFQWSLSGRTIGMAILGARVVTTDGHSVTGKQAAIRTLVLPVSLVLWFIFLVGIELRADRNTLHDRAAGTTVVYFWEARGASMPWLHPEDQPTT